MKDTQSDGVVPKIEHDPEVHEERHGAAPVLKLDPGGLDEGEKEREEAFDGVYFWRGVELLPYSIDRAAAFNELRVAMGAAPMWSVLRGDSDAFLADALRILFLCSHEAKEIRALKRDAEEFQGAVDEWAVKQVSNQERIKATDLALKIWLASRATEHEVVPSGKKDELGN